MAKLEDSRIEETLKQYSGAVLYDTDDPIFDKELKIVLHGSPIIDGRVRMGASGAFYNPQKNEMKKLFRPLYLSDPLLQSIIIDKLMIVKMTLYHQPTIEVAKLLGIAAIESEQFPAITVKDNDNAEKVHWDILLDYNIWCEKENNNVYHLRNQNADLYFSDSIEEIQKIHELKGSQRTLGFGIEKIN